MNWEQLTQTGLLRPHAPHPPPWEARNSDPASPRVPARRVKVHQTFEKKQL